MDSRSVGQKENGRPLVPISLACRNDLPQVILNRIHISIQCAIWLQLKSVAPRPPYSLVMQRLLHELKTWDPTLVTVQLCCNTKTTEVGQ
jgi:hypothetical protein